MNNALPITIVGGGLAGLTLGIALRQRDVPVVIYEAASYPRHRVCGEFISGHGLDVLQELGLYEKFIAAGARVATTSAFYSANRAYPSKMLPHPALCLSRFVMDELLAKTFRELGGTLLEQERIQTTNLASGWVRATGRRIATEPAVIKWIGLKAHVRNVTLDTDLEMHFVPECYVGLCRLSEDTVNVCGLFAVRGPVPQLAIRWPEFLRGPAGSILHQRLQAAEFDAPSFSAVTGLNLKPNTGVASAECCLGDTLTMIPPVTGNGMSMAFESARVAVNPLAAYSRGEVSWEAARATVARACDENFARRLRWASWFQKALWQPGSRELILATANHVDWLWRFCFAKTR